MKEKGKGERERREDRNGRERIEDERDTRKE